MARTDDIKVKSVMTTSPVTVEVDDTVSDAIAMIRRHRVKELPVLSKGVPVGLVSYTSFIERRSVPINAKVSSIMLPVSKLKEDDSVLDAAELLVASGIRGAPVMRGNRLVGFVSRTDLIRLMPSISEMRRLTVRDIMTSEPQSVTPDEFISRAQVVMEGLNEKALPVIGDGGRLVGVVGMTEVMDTIWSPKGDTPQRSPRPPRKVFDGRTRTQITVGGIMTRNVVSVSPDETLGRVVDLMLDRGLSTLFVTEDERLVGVVDQSDLMAQLLSLRPRDQVFVQISGMTIHEPDVLDGLYSLIGKAMKRVAKMDRPRVFYLHVTTYDTEGLASKFSLRVRLNTDGAMYYVKGAGWDLYKAMSDVLEALETKVRREKEKSLDRRKGR
ncbi:MAG TPA: CBS domain-containing protein [Thermoplasmata archaeon]|nr:CBS domain-containing protein [Thermoplasmata archaeon]